MANDRQRNDNGASWRPRDGQQPIDHDREQEHLDSEYRDYMTHASETTTETTKGSERYVSRDYYQSGEGYNPIGSEYLRDIGVGSEDEQSRRDEEHGFSKTPWREQ